MNIVITIITIILVVGAGLGLVLSSLWLLRLLDPSASEECGICEASRVEQPRLPLRGDASVRNANAPLLQRCEGGGSQDFEPLPWRELMAFGGIWLVSLVQSGFQWPSAVGRNVNEQCCACYRHPIATATLLLSRHSAAPKVQGATAAIAARSNSNPETVRRETGDSDVFRVLCFYVLFLYCYYLLFLLFSDRFFW